MARRTIRGGFHPNHYRELSDGTHIRFKTRSHKMEEGYVVMKILRGEPIPSYLYRAYRFKPYQRVNPKCDRYLVDAGVRQFKRKKAEGYRYDTKYYLVYCNSITIQVLDD